MTSPLYKEMGLADTRFKCPKCNDMRRGWELYPGQTTINGERITIRLCCACRYVSINDGTIYSANKWLNQSCLVADPDAACKVFAPLFIKPEPEVVTKTVTKSVLIGTTKALFDELLVAPDEQTFTYRDRIVLVSNDGVEFFTHASVISRDSPTLRKFYHGKYDVKVAGADSAARVTDGTEYRSFKLEEADRVVLDQMLRFIYLDELPKASAQLGPLIRVCHFLEIERFLSSVGQIFEKAVEDGSLTKELVKELLPYLVKFECTEALDAVMKENIK